MKFFSVAIIGFFVFSFSDLQAQDAKISWAHVGLNAGSAYPQGAFASQYADPMFNFGVDVMLGVPSINTMFGIQYRRVNMGRSEHLIDTLTPVGQGLYAEGIETETRTHMNIIHLGARFIPLKNSTLSPYLDLAGGFKSIDNVGTVTAIYKNGEELLYEPEQHKFAFSYSTGLGFLYQINENFMVDVRGQWHGSSSTQYPVKDQVEVDSQGMPDVKYTRSKTDMWIFSVGIVVYNLSGD